MTNLDRLKQEQGFTPMLWVWFITNLVNHHGEEVAGLWLGSEWQKGGLTGAFVWAHTPQGHMFWSEWSFKFDGEEVSDEKA